VRERERDKFLCKRVQLGKKLNFHRHSSASVGEE
jgi:hypothetical protein